jgi:hypothetical protein
MSPLVNPFIDEVGGGCQDKYQDSHAVKVGSGVPAARIVNEGARDALFRAWRVAVKIDLLHPSSDSTSEQEPV